MLLCCVKKCFTNEQASFTMQKLKMSFFHLLESLFTCFLKDKTLHNHWDYAGFTVPYYNIPSNNRELQLPSTMIQKPLIITYQVITGNYSIPGPCRHNRRIITYQVITGNYSCTAKYRSLKRYYNIPSNNRELQRRLLYSMYLIYYNIPSNNRELQL